MLEVTSWRRGSSTIIFITLLLVALADWLFYRHVVGWTLGLYSAAVLASVALRSGYPAATWRGWWAAAGLIGLVAALIEYPGTLATMLTVAAVISFALFSRTRSPCSLGRWVRRISRFLLTAWMKVFADARLIHRWQRSRERRFAQVQRRVMQWGIAVVLSLVFVGMFALANPVIQQWGDRIHQSIQDLFQTLPPVRMFLWGIVGIWVWGLLRARPRGSRRSASMFQAVRRAASGARPSVSLKALLDQFCGADFVIRCLIVFNTVFLVQTVLDIVYLFGWTELPEGMTYAEYAHRGAYPLIATALLSGLFVLVAFRPGSDTQAHSFCRRLVYVWLAQNVFLTFGSVWRLSLYVDVYSLSRWRVAAAIWMALVAMGLVWISWRILANRTSAWLLQVNLCTLAVVLYVCIFVNFDGLVAHYNVRHCKELTGRGAPLDLAYLEHLGPETMPAIDWLILRTKGQGIEVNQVLPSRGTHVTRSDHADSQPLLLFPIDQVAAGVRDRLVEKLRRDISDWRGWSFRRHRLASRFVDGDENARMARRVGGDGY